MPEDAPPNGGAPTEETAPAGLIGGYQRCRPSFTDGQADPGRRFDDLFNFVCDPTTLAVAWSRVASNRGSHRGPDGLTVARIESEIGVPEFLDELRSQLKDARFRPQPVRERKIPKPGGSGKVRRLGFPPLPTVSFRRR